MVGHAAAFPVEPQHAPARGVGIAVVNGGDSVLGHGSSARMMARRQPWRPPARGQCPGHRTKEGWGFGDRGHVEVQVGGALIGRRILGCAGHRDVGSGDCLEAGSADNLTCRFEHLLLDLLIGQGHRSLDGGPAQVIDAVHGDEGRTQHQGHHQGSSNEQRIRSGAEAVAFHGFLAQVSDTGDVTGPVRDPWRGACGEFFAVSPFIRQS